MLAPLLMVPAPCPLHLRPGGGARPALRPGEPPPPLPRAGPTATRRCGQPRGRGAAGGWPRRRSPHARRAASRGARGHRPRSSGAPRLPPSAARRRAPLRCHRRVRPPARPRARSLARPAPSLSGARVGHRASRGPHTRAAARRRRPAPPRLRPCAARPRPQPRPTCSAPPPAAPRGAPPSSQHVMTQDAVTPCLSHPAEVQGLGRSSPGTCFPACKGV